MVYIHKTMTDRVVVTPPTTDKTTKHYKIGLTYRQGRHCLDTYKYVYSHIDDYGVPLEWVSSVRGDDERLPVSANSVWVRCGKGGTQLEVLQKVKEILVSEEIGENEEKTVMVLYLDNDESAATFCEENNWKYVYSDTIFGYEAEVIIIIIVVITNSVTLGGGEYHRVGWC